MNEALLRKIIHYIVEKARGGYHSLTRIRIVKLLYLIDERCYGFTNNLATGLDWVFLHYGPYTAQIQNTLDQMVSVELEEEAFDAGFSYKPLSKSNPSDILTDASLTAYYIDPVLDIWLKKETSKILDYVYNDSLPMFGVERRERLRFENITEHKKRIKEEEEWVKEANRRFLASPRIKMLLEYKKKRKPTNPIYPKEIIGTRLHIEGMEEDDY